uniref:Variant surface glycoprotein n=1 Tax=Trypanosoma brucei TaxID=5691 RepID=S5FWW3_9TRYP|nr:variant surface glycoprotein [Trypanosoma brucei]
MSGVVRTKALENPSSHSAAAFVIFLVISTGASANKAPINIDGAEQVCLVSQQLKQAAGYYAETEKKRLETAVKLHKLSREVRTLASKGQLSNETWVAWLLNSLEKELSSTLQTAEEQTQKAIAAAAVCSQAAGHLSEFINIFYNAQGSTNYCIDNGGSKYTISGGSNKLAGCLNDQGKTELKAPLPSATKPDIDAAMKTMSDKQGTLASGQSAKCFLTQHGSSGGEAYAENGQQPTISWGLGIFTVTGTSAATTDNWSHRAKAAAAATPFELCHTSIKNADAGFAHDNAKIATLVMLDSETPKIQANLDLEPKYITADYPQAKLTISKENLQSVQTAIKNLRASNSQTGQMDKLMAVEVEKLLSDKECQPSPPLAAAKPETQVSTQAAECNKQKTKKSCSTSNCKWEGTTETVGECKPKDGEETQAPAAGTGPGAAGTNSEAKKCSEKTKQEDCKDGCNWDGKECKDSSILVTKKFALSVVSAAFVALLF